MTFGETNAKILALLQRDSSLTNEPIGSAVNLSSTAVIKRVKKLRDSGIIEATVAVLSLQAAGPIVSALVLCSFDPDGAATIDQFAQTILSRPEITNAWVVTGEVDVVLLVLTRTVEEYDLRMRELQEAHPQLKNVRTFVVLRHVKRSLAIPHAILTGPGGAGAQTNRGASATALNSHLLRARFHFRCPARVFSSAKLNSRVEDFREADPKAR